ncbi:MAG: glycosyltransferase [Opitutae bacterium]|nr:glycosyltransferase [Opitutae bacterium]
MGLGDALIVPLGETALARSQMPCKVFEAMAMGKPVVASTVSDLPEVLEGCGHLVAPNSSEAAAQVLAGIFADPEAARAMGTRARERCIEKYGVETSRKALLELLEELK